ncbi:MAG TPA: hypothetical protein VJ974_04685 [Geopsychrobacteraceae bacterium]|nr:hypothetical protein [Geopsychrobacteraceae bacterium]
MKLRIVVFDLDESIRELLSVVARNKGHEVLAFAEPVACPLYSDSDCKCTQEYTCGDLMIIDKRMLRMSTFDFIRKQIENGCKGATQNKLVLSTTGSSEKEIAVAKELGFTLMKMPFSVKEIADWIDECEKRIDPNRKLAELHMA